jgi:predicted amidohydrolase
VPPSIRLVAVQARWRPADYASPEAFAGRVRDLCLRAVEGAPGPALVAFPELWALPLLATAGGVADRLPAGLRAVVNELGRRHAARWTRTSLRRRWWHWSTAAYQELGVGAYDLWTQAFSAAARASGATLVAGSGFFPTIAYEAARGLHVVDPRTTNLALAFSPGGAVVARAAKVFLTDGLERRVGLAHGRVEDLPVVPTPVGRLALAVCLDGWYHHVLERLDGLGAQVLVQPSANMADWERRWPPDGRFSEGEAWLRLGLRAGIAGRANLRYGVNPMLVGDLPPLSPRGRSTVVARVAEADGAGPADGRWGPEHGVVAIAPDAEGEALVIADVPHPDDA